MPWLRHSSFGANVGPMRGPTVLCAALLLGCVTPLRARAADLVLTPPEVPEFAGGGSGAALPRERLELGLGVGELAGDLVLRSAFFGLSMAILCIGTCASAVSPWEGTLALLLLHPLLDAALVWGIGLSSSAYHPRYLWTLLASYGGAVAEGLLILIGVATGNWGLTVALGLVGCALASAGTVYVQVITKESLDAPPRTPAPALTLATF
jgi:hypothetical protein